MTHLARTLAAASLGLLISVSAFAGTFSSAPECENNDGQPIAINNSQVLTWEKTTANQFLARANVEGDVVAIYPNQTGHNHFAIQIGSDPSQTLEVIYDIGFGQLPQIQKGMHIQACGDYITSDEATSQYPVSPCGAIIHWVHMAPKPTHKNGFLMINGQVYGQNDPKDGH
jgi:hypothetical protein